MANVKLLTVVAVIFCSTAIALEGVAAKNDTRLNVSSNLPYLEILRGRDGPPGRDGRDGRDGAPGLQGPPGTQGLPGPSGLPGPPGQPGQDGDPGINGDKSDDGLKYAGTTYTRWGKASCPEEIGTELLYAGRAGGSNNGHKGSGANFLCMPEEPEYTLSFISGNQGGSYMYGMEYQNPVEGINAGNVPCAVCYTSTRAAVIMIPAKTTCPQSWTREYYGYLMSSHHIHHRSTYVCVDKDQDSVPGTQIGENSVDLYHVEAICVGLPCAPYNSAKELNCVVCTK